MRMQHWMWILWPAFLLACALEMVVFALVDPGDLSWHGAAIGVSRQAVYSGAFLLFWLLAAASNVLLLLTRTAPEINSPGD